MTDKPLWDLPRTFTKVFPENHVVQAYREVMDAAIAGLLVQARDQAATAGLGPMDYRLVLRYTPEHVEDTDTNMLRIEATVQPFAVPVADPPQVVTQPGPPDTDLEPTPDRAPVEDDD